MTSPQVDVAQALAADPTLMSLLRSQAAARPSHPAIVAMTGPNDPDPRVFSYADLLGRVEATAAAFAGFGLDRDSSVAIHLPVCPESVVAFIAAASVGIAFPLNPLLSADALTSQLDLGAAAILLSATSQAAGEGPKGPGATCRPVRQLILDLGAGDGGSDWRDFLAASPTPSPEFGTGRTAALFHTGGTTGSPKLAELSEANLVAGALLAAHALAYRADDRILNGLPLFHVGGLIDIVLASFAVGGTVILPSPLGARDPNVVSGIWDLVDRTRTTLIGMVPTSLGLVAERPLGDANLDALRGFVTGASPLPGHIALKLQAMTGRPVCQVYGMTELSGICSAQPVDGEIRTLAVGFIPSPMEVRIVDGEAQFRGPNVFQGYRTTAGTSRGSVEGWVHSGDLGDIGVDGQLRLSGRSKDMIIRGGHNIDPAMIDDAALAHPDVLQAAAVAMPDSYAGEVPVLFVVLRPGSSCLVEDIQEFVAARLGEPPARPKQLFVIESLPLTPVGKVARYKLRQEATAYKVREALDHLPFEDVRCDDVAARTVMVVWRVGADAESRREGGRRIESLGLSALTERDQKFGAKRSESI
ncbi:AMP-binding protein [Phenylobacterium sp.]|uniref:AMP-binding protein n=1 Tax=Phenylobacterium sp. TaxID=1871053 RepID=UPI002FC832B2